MEETISKKTPGRRLRRITEGKHARFCGVCAGVAYWIGLPVWLVRVAWIISVLVCGFGILPYVLLWMFMPIWDETPEDFEQVTAG